MIAESAHLPVSGDESAMARLPRSGASFSSLYEYEITLEDVISNLGFRPLSKKDESFVRSKMGHAIGQWGMAEGDYQATGAKLDIKDIRQSLNGLAIRLEEVHKILAALEDGLHHTHGIAVVGQIASALSENPEIGSVERAQKFLSDFRNRAWTVAHGTRVADWLLSSLPKRPHGRIRQDWHDDFTRAVMRVCELNGAAATIATNRETGEPTGQFLNAAAALQRLLDPRMRAPSLVALAQRLERSKKRIKTTKADG
jgi:hypothetical protein